MSTELATLARDGLEAREVDNARRYLEARSRHETSDPRIVMGHAVGELLALRKRSTYADLFYRAVEAPFEEIDAFARAFYAPASFARVSLTRRGTRRDLLADRER